jgi:cell division protein FtsW (lipid II flippase)
MRNRPSSHLLILLVLFVLNALGYLAIYRAGIVRGYAPSLLLALRDLLLFIPLAFTFLWLARRHKFAGDWTLFTVALLLFSVGQIVQYRLFTDPEYSARRKSEVRQEKMNTLRLRYVNDHYDETKKRALFGDPNFRLNVNAQAEEEEQYWTLTRIFTSISTWILLAALLGFALAFTLTNRDDLLLWVQQHSFLIGLASALPFLLIAVIASSGGKFLGRTTPWEPVKISFLLSFAGILAAHYRNLSRTYWGLPPARFVFPFLIVALLPIVPFFALSDFGQMLVFFGAYLSLYVVAVRRLPQVTMAVILVLVLVTSSILLAGAYNTVVDVFTDQAQVGAVERVKGLLGKGVPRRIHQRFHLWLNAVQPPDPEADWWQKESEAAEGRGISNEDAWYNSYAFQPSQALFGVSDGRVLGAGLGRGFPEIVPIADSDYIYAALAEELGLAGGAIVILAYVILLIAGMRTAIEARDMFTKLIAAGITAFLGFQAVVNIGGVIRMLPMTGITLPFVSHGGWSLMTSFFMLGVLMAISHRNNTAVSLPSAAAAQAAP